MSPAVTIQDLQVILTQPAGSRLVVVKIITSEPGLYGIGCATFTQRFHAVHAAIERLTLDWPDDLPDDCETILHDHLLRELGARGFEDAAMAREA